MKSKKKICVVTSSRADFGLLKELLLKLDSIFNLKLIVTGSHLSKQFGYTKNDIIKNKIPIYKSVKIFEKPSKKKFDETYILNTISKTIIKFDKIFKKVDPEIIIVLGDRYEIFACTIAATVNRKLLAHIHGGETTTNALDDSFRHSISQMSQIHFVAAKKYYDRVVQLGKHPSNVHLVGGLGPSNIQKIKIKKRDLLSKDLNFDLTKKYAIIIYHPETKQKNYGIDGLKSILKVLSQFKDLVIIGIYPNADTSNEKFIKLIIKNNVCDIKLFKSIDYLNYISLLKHSEFLIGNSSSGIIEAPSLKVPTINIGNRQHGRLRAKSIIDVDYSQRNIESAINKVLSKKFIKNINNVSNPYSHGNTINKIIKVLKKNISYGMIDNMEFFNLKIK
jgi:GDP/UDP-N,N'-diacetylbacillosamine 2-epimerase (hydrolysing)